MKNKNEKNKSENIQPDEETKIYLTPNSTLQTPEEHKHDQSVDATKDSTIDVSNSDLRETELDRNRGEMFDITGDDNSDNS
ncbi:MAG TPA: hypothetical protein VEY10_13155 [Flavisolibacter sp.]|jgi:hypothetical protein|nr:hypothetical protein [Flavisolibacter sp.]